MFSSEMRVVIVGAGVGGLTLALLLRRQGVAAEVVEQAPELREAGAAIALAANATRVLRHLGLGDDLARLSTQPAAVIHRDGRDGHLAAELGAATDLAAALRRYEDRRKARTRQVQAASWAASAALHLARGRALQARDAYLAQLPQRLAWIHGHNVLAEGCAAIPSVRYSWPA